MARAGLTGRHETDDPAATERLGARLAEELAPGDVVLVSGDLGAGKTTFVRGACRALGVQGPVTSPTFTLAARHDDGRVPISHLDLYRLAALDDEDLAQLDDELGPDRIAFVEWPEHGAATLARATRRVAIEHGGGDRRRIAIEAPAGAEGEGGL